MVDDNKSDTKLLLRKTPSYIVNYTVFFHFKTGFLILGLIAGLIIQLFSLSVFYLAVSYMGELILLLTQRDLILISVSWSLLISYMALLLLPFLHSLIHSTYQGEDVKDIDLHVQSRYVFGALIGVCMSWAATVVALGLTGQVVYPVISLVVALPAWFFASPLKNRVLVKKMEAKDEIMMV